MFASVVFNKIPYKSLLIYSYIGNGLSLVLFSYSHEYYVQCIARFACGFFQTFHTVYMPLYVDTFSKESCKSVDMSMMLLSSPIGVILGYILSALVN